MNSAARTLSVTFIDDDGYKHERTGLDIEKGHRCIFYWEDKELFRGIFLRQDQSQGKALTAIAYDNGIYLANNKDTFVYENKTASQIFSDVCSRFGIPTGSVAGTKHVIAELPKPKTTGWDVITDALSQTYKATGVRYYPICRQGKMELLERRQSIMQWVIESGANLMDYRFTKNMEKIKTRIKVYSKEDKVMAEAVDSGLEKKIGQFQDIEQSDDEMTDAQINELAKTTLAENNKPDKTMQITAPGKTDIVTGIGVMLIIKELGTNGTYYVEDDTHSFKGEFHEMKLKVISAADTAKNDAKTEQPKDLKEGDIVNFSGGSHYVSSVAKSPTGKTRTAGKAKLTKIAKGAPHPYHLIGEKGGSNVYGWVDAGTVSK